MRLWLFLVNTKWHQVAEMYFGPVPLLGLEGVSLADNIDCHQCWSESKHTRSIFCDLNLEIKLHVACKLLSTCSLTYVNDDKFYQ